MHRDLKFGNIMVHFNNRTTTLMDMLADDKLMFLENVNL